VKNLGLVFALLIGLGLTTGCNNSNNSTTRVPVGRGVPLPGSPLVGSPGAELLPGWGMVVSNAGDAEFTNQVKGFTSATLNPIEMGNLASTFNEQEASMTGVRFYGTIEVTPEGFINGNSSSLVMYFWDDRVGASGSNGSKMPAYVAGFTRIVASVVDSQRAVLEFEDNYSRVILDGNYSSGIYEGTISYINYVSYDGVLPTRQGQLGHFRIRTCDFFRCDSVRY
jgi:hypothetical protein